MISAPTVWHGAIAPAAFIGGRPVAKACKAELEAGERLPPPSASETGLGRSAIPLFALQNATALPPPPSRSSGSHALGPCVHQRAGPARRDRNARERICDARWWRLAKNTRIRNHGAWALVSASVAPAHAPRSYVHTTTRSGPLPMSKLMCSSRKQPVDRAQA